MNKKKPRTTQFRQLFSSPGPKVHVNYCHHYGKNVSKRFFSETTGIIETKLPRNDHCKVLYKVSVFLCRSEIQDGRHRRT